MVFSLFWRRNAAISYLFRADSRSPQKIKKSGGFVCRDPYANMDAKSHVIYGGPSNFIATSKSIKGTLANLPINGTIHIYKINPYNLKLEIVQYEEGSIMRAYQQEKEVLVDQFIPWENIEGWYVLNDDNSNYYLQTYVPSTETDYINTSKQLP